MAKHVIFLGAGASVTSGYPLAADLRLILSSKNSYSRYLEQKLPGDEHKNLRANLVGHFDQTQNAIRLFREGGFATIDEFSYLAGPKFAAEIQSLRKLLTLVLSLHFPEATYKCSRRRTETDGFETSDYYAFIQRLFDSTLHELRDDVVILSYNYDCYLEFILNRAYIRRKQASHLQVKAYPPSLVSGFGNREADAIRTGSGFCLLKLHGTIALPFLTKVQGQASEYLTFDELFGNRKTLFNQLESHGFGDSPIFFPWEVMTKDGSFVSEQEFQLHEALASNSIFIQQIGRPLYLLCKAIWERAQREIVDAEKISFIGLSMHEFLKPGLRYLFAERVRKFKESETKDRDYGLEIIFADPSTGTPSENYRKLPRSNSPVARLVKMLREVNPGMAGGDNDILTPNTGKAGLGRVVCYEDFASFIKAEL